MAVILVGRLRIVSLSITALQRPVAKEHVLQERLDPAPLNTVIEPRRSHESGFYCRTICGLKIIATSKETPVYVNGKRSNHHQARLACGRCSATKSGKGELSISLLDPGEAQGWEDSGESMLPRLPEIIRSLRSAS